MTTPQANAASRPLGRRGALVAFAAAAVVVVGGLALVGWATDLGALKTILPGLVSMKVNTALAFILGGVALLPFRHDEPRRSQSHFGRLSALAVAVIGTLTLVEHVAGVNLGIDELLFADPASAAVLRPPGRMSSATALGFLLLGSALVARHAGRSPACVLWLGVPAFFVYLLALAGYLFGVSALYAVGPYSSMAVHTAACGLLLSLGAMVSTPAGGLPAILAADDVSGVLVRRLLPAACLLPLVVGGLVGGGVRVGLFREAFACALFAIAMIAVLVIGVLLVARQLRRTDEGRLAAERRLRDSESIYRAVGESIDYGIWVCNPDGRNIYASPSFLKMVGLTQEECSEFGWGRVLHPDDAERTIAAWKECVRVRGRWDVEHRFLGTDGRLHPVLARGVPVFDERGDIKCWAGINLDIGDLKRAEESLRELNATLERRVAERSAAAEERALALAASESELRHLVGKLRENEELFRTAFDFAAIGKGLVDLEGRWLRVNRALCDIVGYSEAELLATDFQSITHPDDLEADLDNARRLLAGEIPSYQMEKRYIHKDGHAISILLSASLIRDAAGVPSYFVAQIQDLTQLKAAEERNRRALLQARFVEQSIAAREDEQRRISRDLHDGVGQTLTSIRLGLRVLEETFDAVSGPATAGELRRMVVGAQDEVRRLVKNLRPSVLDDVGLVPALRQLVDEFAAAHGVEIRLRADPAADDRFAGAVETALYRIVQESLANVVKHSGARSAEVVLRRDSAGIELSIVDDGVGFDPKATPDGAECFGIVGMRERVSLLDGTFEMFRGKTGGTTVRVSIPPANEAAA